MRPPSRRMIASIAAVVVTAMTAYVAVPAGASTPALETDPVSTLRELVPEVLDTTPDTSSSGGEEASIPVQPAEGISLTSVVGEIGVGLPRGDAADAAITDPDGQISYDNRDGSSTVPVAKSGGAVQILTVIDEPSAPERYEYPTILPAGAFLVRDDDGSVSAQTATGETIAYVAAAWATDANGDHVPTWYEIQGNTLVQVVLHQSAAHPVVADPFWIPFLGIVARWTAHALKKMAERNISENLVRIALQEGRRTPGNEKGTSVFSANGIRVVVNDRTGAIITVTRAGGGGASGGR